MVDATMVMVQLDAVHEAASGARSPETWTYPSLAERGTSTSHTHGSQARGRRSSALPTSFGTSRKAVA